MILNYYNLGEQPFGVTPDPRYLYLGPTHREALASLVYGIQSGCGFMCLIASPGMGKTTIVYHLLEQFRSSARTVFLCRTLRGAEDIMRAVLNELGVVDDGSDVVRMDARLNELLLQEASQGRKVILVIDEAQNLDDSALELVRLLSNFETGSQKLMQIILSGQPQLWEKLASPHLLQLRQRMSMIARLEPLDAEDTRRYIAQRLRAAGYQSPDPLFAPPAEALIAKHSAGIPRNINNICFNALSLGYVLKQKPIRQDAVKEALTDLGLGEPASASVSEWADKGGGVTPEPFWSWPKLVAIYTLLLLVALLVAPGVWRRVEARVSQAGSISPRTRAVHAISPPAKAESLPEVVASHANASESGLQPTLTTLSGDSSTAALPRQKTPRDLNIDPTISSDPAKLWEQVKKQDSKAEVALARMYLQGTEVPRNCQQARVLLLAASKRGNARAAFILNNDADKCH